MPVAALGCKIRLRYQRRLSYAECRFGYGGGGGQISNGFVETNYGFSPDRRFIKGGTVSLFANFGGSSVQTSGDLQ